MDYLNYGYRANITCEAKLSRLPCVGTQPVWKFKFFIVQIRLLDKISDSLDTPGKKSGIADCDDYV
jgi:hypothetical protein